MLPRRLQEAMFTGLAAAYPDEGCGFLIGRIDDDVKTVEAVRAAPNTYEGSRRTRFIIHPKELLALEDELEGTDREILGFYHSHPDHPAVPSAFDREHAWPTYSYVVVSVLQGKPDRLTSWLLEPDRSRFKEENVRTL